MGVVSLSVFDGLQFSRHKQFSGLYRDADDYYFKPVYLQNRRDIEDTYKDVHKNIKIEFFKKSLNEEDWAKTFRVRSSYRNDQGTELGSNRSLRLGQPYYESHRMTENDSSLLINYGWLLSQWIELSSHTENAAKTVKALQNKVFGKLRYIMGRIFDNPELVLIGLGNILDQQMFHFKKGSSREFSSMNLSSGEKAVLDLFLDVIVTKTKYDETIICIDETRGTYPHKTSRTTS